MKNFSQKLFEILKEESSDTLIRNLHARLEFLTVQDQALLCSVNDRPSNSAWSVSIYAMVVDYAKDELFKLSKIQQLLVIPIRLFVGGLFRLVNLDRIAILNNYCLSTNLFSEEFKSMNMTELTSFALKKYPTHALLIRSLNKHHHASLMKNLQEDGWQFLVNRQIYLIDNPKAALRTRDNKKDLKLLKDGKYIFRKLKRSDCKEDFEAVEKFYNLLYLEKYSSTNIQFTALLFQKLVRENLAKIFLLEDKAGKAVACLGLIEENGIVTAPIFGYDTSLPLQEGLYRRLSIFLTTYCAERGVKQHLSAGAPSFKCLRGACPYIEYIAVYSHHLPVYKRIVWKVLQYSAEKIYKPLLERNHL